MEAAFFGAALLLLQDPDQRPIAARGILHTSRRI